MIETKSVMTREADISECGRFRYTLLRRWAAGPSAVTWIMLNPSTADAEKDDPTIRRCMKFTERFGYKEMVVVNLFALRATDPRELLVAEDPVGPENGAYVRKACDQAGLIVAAWGGVKYPHSDAVATISEVITGAGYELKCLGTTKEGQPRHPLRLRADTPLVPWHSRSES